MTRSWVFTLVKANQQYNLWNDLIVKDPFFVDPFFGNAPFVPSMVCDLVIQSQNATKNAANGGSIITWSSDSNVEGGIDLQSGDGSRLGPNSTNIIDLKKQFFSSDTAGVKINVQATSH